MLQLLHRMLPCGDAVNIIVNYNGQVSFVQCEHFSVYIVAQSVVGREVLVEIL